MTAYNVVRFRTKPGMEQTFIDVHKKSHLNAKGFRGGALIKTGERSFCLIGEWAKMDNIAGARPAMIGMLDQFRGILEDLGGGLGVTDPVSGSVVADIKAPRKKAKKAPKKRGKKKRKR
jgi:hypothetical protein